MNQTGPDGRSTAAAQLAVQLALVGLAAVTLIVLMWPFLPALVTASVLALILLPIHRWMLAKARRPGLAAALTTVCGIAGLVIPLFALGAVVLEEAGGLAERLIDDEMAFRLLPQLERAIDGVVARLGFGQVEVGHRVAQWVREVPDFLAGRAFGLLAGLGGLAVQGGVAFFALFFLLRDRVMIENQIRRLIPLDSHRTGALLSRVREVAAAVVYGNLLVAVIQGLLGGTAFLVLGLSAPAVWGSLMGAASLVPMVGPGLVWLPTSLFLLASGSPVRGLLLFAFGVAVISTVDNVIRAVLAGSRAKTHPLAIFMGVLGGIVLFGVVGVFVGPVVLVVSLTLLEMGRLSLFPDDTQEAE